MAVREKVGAIEIANFANHRFCGKGARTFLEFVLVGIIPKPGRVILNPMLRESGKLYGDFTVACIDEETFYLLGSSVAQEMHRRWFDEKLVDFKDVTYKNMTDESGLEFF